MDRGSTSTVGTVLLIGIVVVSSGVIAAFALGLAGQSTQEDPAPAAVIDVGFKDDGNVTLTHDGGENIPAGSIEVQGASGPVDEPLSAGRSVTVGSVDPDAEVVWVVTEDGRHVLKTEAVPNLGALDVTVDSTNSPVTEGNTLDVTATLTNTGTVEITEQVDLKMLDKSDSSQEIVDNTSVTLAPNESTTVALSWTTKSGDAGDYSAIVQTEEGAATESVTVQGSGGSGGSSPAFNLPALVVPIAIALLVRSRLGPVGGAGVSAVGDDDEPDTDSPGDTSNDSEAAERDHEKSEGAERDHRSSTKNETGSTEDRSRSADRNDRTGTNDDR